MACSKFTTTRLLITTNNIFCVSVTTAVRPQKTLWTFATSIRSVTWALRLNPPAQCLKRSRRAAPQRGDWRAPNGALNRRGEGSATWQDDASPSQVPTCKPEAHWLDLGPDKSWWIPSRWHLRLLAEPFPRWYSLNQTKSAWANFYRWKASGSTSYSS